MHWTLCQCRLFRKSGFWYVDFDAKGAIRTRVQLWAAKSRVNMGRNDMGTHALPRRCSVTANQSGIKQFIFGQRRQWRRTQHLNKQNATAPASVSLALQYLNLIHTGIPRIDQTVCKIMPIRGSGGGVGIGNGVTQFGRAGPLARTDHRLCAVQGDVTEGADGRFGTDNVSFRRFTQPSVVSISAKPQ